MYEFINFVNSRRCFLHRIERSSYHTRYFPFLRCIAITFYPRLPFYQRNLVGCMWSTCLRKGSLSLSHRKATGLLVSAYKKAHPSRNSYHSKRRFLCKQRSWIKYPRFPSKTCAFRSKSFQWSTITIVIRSIVSIYNSTVVISRNSLISLFKNYLIMIGIPKIIYDI